MLGEVGDLCERGAVVLPEVVDEDADSPENVRLLSRAMVLRLEVLAVLLEPRKEREKQEGI